MSAPALQLLGLPPCVFQLSGPAAQAAHDNVKALVLSGPSDPPPPTMPLKDILLHHARFGGSPCSPLSKSSCSILMATTRARAQKQLMLQGHPRRMIGWCQCPALSSARLDTGCARSWASQTARDNDTANRCLPGLAREQTGGAGRPGARAPARKHAYCQWALANTTSPSSPLYV
jgi:hypothetical protein